MLRAKIGSLRCGAAKRSLYERHRPVTSRVVSKKESRFTPAARPEEDTHRGANPAESFQTTLRLPGHLCTIDIPVGLKCIMLLHAILRLSMHVPKQIL